MSYKNRPASRRQSAQIMRLKLLSTGTVSWDAAGLVDAKTTANGTGNGATVNFGFNYSCNDVNNLSAASKPFFGGGVNFDLIKDDVDAMFAAQP